MLEQARLAARTGVGLDTVLRRYVAGYALLEDFIVREAERVWLPVRGLRDVNAQISGLVDRLITEVSRAYGEELARAAPTASVSAGTDSAVRWRRGGAGPGSASRSEPTSRRDRILDAMTELAAERGFEHVTVRLVTERAGVSSRTFYERFAGLDECLLAILDGVRQHFDVLVSRGFATDGSWLDGMRVTLAGMLAFFDAEPALARVFVVEALGAGPLVRERRERAIEELRRLIVARIEAEVTHVSPLEPEGVIASVMGIVHARLTMGDSEQPFVELLGPLMGIVVRPFTGRDQVTREIEKGDRFAHELLAERELALRVARDDDGTEEESVAVPAALLDPRAHRLRLCLRYVVEQGARGRAPSNQAVGAAIGVAHRGQLFKLLCRLADLGLLAKRPGARGHPNAWSATPAGEQVARALARDVGRDRPSDIRPGLER